MLCRYKHCQCSSEGTTVVPRDLFPFLQLVEKICSLENTNPDNSIHTLIGIDAFGRAISLLVVSKRTSVILLTVCRNSLDILNRNLITIDQRIAFAKV